MPKANAFVADSSRDPALIVTMVKEGFEWKTQSSAQMALIIIRSGVAISNPRFIRQISSSVSLESLRSAASRSRVDHF
jgi:hypothetical protein